MLFNINAALLDALVLAVVNTHDIYGYEITQILKDSLDVSESTLYPVLRRLQKDDCLEAYDREYNGRNRRYYRMTEKGRCQLALYCQEWKRYKEKINGIMLHGTDGCEDGYQKARGREND